jgi:hypothetical protein
MTEKIKHRPPDYIVARVSHELQHRLQLRKMYASHELRHRLRLIKMRYSHELQYMLELRKMPQTIRLLCDLC